MSNLKENVQHINEHSQEYIEKQLEYYKLSLFKKLMKGATAFVHFLIIGAILFLTVIFISLAGAWSLAGWLDNIPLAFIIMGLFYAIILFLFVKVFKKRLDVRILKASSKEFFD
ncbi:phage holin family protein [Robertkochia flava]|uniref:phage holin family protein n=1 Tax=Robertkochia flava TaxID=3447986 RepID=UPI001CC90A89|nr:phage holin family protein [Robertkochia marina]